MLCILFFRPAWLAKAVLDLLSQISLWSPWGHVSIESSSLQIFIVLSFLFFVTARSLFYALTYLFIFFIWIGLFLAYYGVEMFTGFF